MSAIEDCLLKIKSTVVTDEERNLQAIALAAMLLEEAKRVQTHAEKKAQAQLAKMMHDPRGKAFTTNMTDQCFRSKAAARVANQLAYLIDQYGIPKYLSRFKQMQMKLFRIFGQKFSALFVPLIKRELHNQTKAVILPGEPDKLLAHLQTRRNEGVRVNLNHLGEAILGEAEAKQRLQVYLNDLAHPEIEYISIKISTIYSQISLLGWDATLKVLAERLKLLYRTAYRHYYKGLDGKQVPKFVNLDMEEYRDLALTVAVFKQVLDEKEFLPHSAGIVLQSYLPDSFLVQQELTKWAVERVSKGGAPIKIRLVKGANLGMERVEAAIKDWPQAPYLSKVETDANYKRMLLYGCKPAHAKAVHLGIASHNLFDISLGLLLRAENNLDSSICFEMLEGMADHIRRVVQKVSGNMLLYCPAATKAEFQNAIAYLLRRLDENTSKDNFLRYTFDMTPGDKNWQAQAQIFLEACRQANSVSAAPRRLQDRNQISEIITAETPFSNAADTDWSLAQNRQWALSLSQEWAHKTFETIPLVMGSQKVSSGLHLAEGVDPSFPDKVLYRYALAQEKELETALNTSLKGFQKWSSYPFSKRAEILAQVATGLKAARGQLIGAMLADTGKTIAEADVEVSEAIDFATYYRSNCQALPQFADIEWQAKGPILVASPWNFPCSIPAGGILAALAAGNSVIFKPAPEAVLVGWELASLFWQAGVDPTVLQFFCCQDDPIGSKLIRDQRLAAVILTGASDTARHFLKLRPEINLLAETGGKNAIIVTRMADRDLAIRDVIQSAFGYAGQKCSACSLLILEEEVYHDPAFKRQLRDAAASLQAGIPWDLSTKLNPLIRAPNAALKRGLTSLDAGEEWLLEPKLLSENAQLWSPGIKWGVKPGSFMHQTELFGPVLGVMHAHNLHEAVALANGTAYGLTSGLHSLDEREQKYWLERIVAGNCYINRGITGAIVNRQPFGGCKASSFGVSIKAGGPNYVMQLLHATQKNLPKETNGERDKFLRDLGARVRKNSGKQEIDLWEASVGNYAYVYQHYFSKPHALVTLVGQDNLLFYVSREPIAYRISTQDSVLDIARVLAAAHICQTKLDVSMPQEFVAKNAFADLLTWHVESEEQFIARIIFYDIKRSRFLSPPSTYLQQALAETACNMNVAAVLANGRIELLHYLREVSLSRDYHRYGYVA